MVEPNLRAGRHCISPMLPKVKQRISNDKEDTDHLFLLFICFNDT